MDGEKLNIDPLLSDHNSVYLQSIWMSARSRHEQLSSTQLEELVEVMLDFSSTADLVTKVAILISNCFRTAGNKGRLIR